MLSHRLVTSEGLFVVFIKGSSNVRKVEQLSTGGRRTRRKKKRRNELNSDIFQPAKKKKKKRLYLNFNIHGSISTEAIFFKLVALQERPSGVRVENAEGD